MPRDGSINLPSGAVPAAAMDVGEVANPPFAILPDPELIFLTRSERFAALAPGHQLEPYLMFLAALSRAQHDVQASLAPPELPPADRLAMAREHKMPPISFAHVALGDVADATFKGIVDQLAVAELTDAARVAVENVRTASAADRAAMMRAVLMDDVPETAIAEHVLAAAAVQVHLTRLAARLDVDTLSSVADAACPACGSGPVSSMVVGRNGMHGSRFCICSICATNWHVVRIKWLSCGSEQGIAYQSIEGGSLVVMGETCESCHSYVKILHQHKDAALDPVADDVASLALDLVLGKDGWVRASANPFLLGY